MTEQTTQAQPSEKTETKQTRVNDILLGPLERPALKWLSEHMPNWISSDMMTGLGVVASIIIFLAYIMVGRGGPDPKGNWFLMLASFGFFLNWFGDSLDGTLARYRHLERPRFGYYIDHSIDAFSAVMMFLGIGLAGLSDFTVATFTLIGYLLAMISVYLKTHVTGVFVMTNMKLGPTEIRVIAIIFNTLVFLRGNKPIENFPFFNQPPTPGTLVLGAIAIILGCYFIYETIFVGRKLAAQDELALARRKEKAERKASKRQLNAEKRVAKRATKATSKARRVSKG
jgi:archaetidylinositol phosphate synthase